MIRQPAVAGQFYPENLNELTKELDSYIMLGHDKVNAFGVLCPHAGYIYSGRVAGSVFAQIKVPDKVIILAPNHTGYGPEFSIWPEGSWRTPLGDVEIDEDLVDKLVNDNDLLVKDCDAHKYEHAAEVILPFLQYKNPKTKVVVIVIMSRSLKKLKELGKSISVSVKDMRSNALMVASSDMTHQESETSANKKDKIAIEEIIKLDEDGLFNKVEENDISMCGVCPAVSMLVFSKELGASSAHLTKYETSGKTTGDYNHVVGYAGILVK